MWEILKDQRPLILPAGATVQYACQRMRDRRVGAVLITDEARRLLGIFTGRDAVVRVLAEGKDPTKTTLADVMTVDPDTIASGRTAIDALRLMQDGGFRHVPVIQGDELIGIVSHGDFRGLEKARLDEETGLFERLH
jgi:CBS domain-containing protein